MLDQIRDVITNASTPPEPEAAKYNYWGDPPETLKVNIKGLPPHRARLAKFLMWTKYTKVILMTHIERRAALIDLLDEPAKNERRIKDIVQSDVANVIRWVAGEKVVSVEELIRSTERRALEERLQADKQKSDVAKQSLDQAEAEIAAWAERVRILESRIPEFVKAALIEASAAAKDDYIRVVQEYERALKTLWGALHATTGNVEAYSSVTIPDFAFGKIKGTSLLAQPDSLERFARPWRALGEAWLRDIRTDPSAYIRPARDPQ